MSLKWICFSVSLPPSPPPSSSSFPLKNPHRFSISNSTSSSSSYYYSSTTHQLPHFSNKADVTNALRDEDEDDYDDATEQVGVVVDDEEVDLEIDKSGRNSRRIRSAIGIHAPLDVVWSLLTDYERLAEFIPGLAVCRLLEKSENYARLFQIGEQDLAFGMKFNAKGVVDCYENELEKVEDGFGGLILKREIEFNMVEGDFELFRGKWSIQQEIASDPLVGQKTQTATTTLTYSVDVKPKMFLPVRLVEGRLCKEIKINLTCIRDEALRIAGDALFTSK